MVDNKSGSIMDDTQWQMLDEDCVNDNAFGIHLHGTQGFVGGQGARSHCSLL